MGKTAFQKGKFYKLPIKDIRNEGNTSFFIVCANDKEYAIRMFDFQRHDKSVLSMTELPCMAKDVHGDSIVFVQNFAEMFGDRYDNGKSYPFIVNKEAYYPDMDFRYYDVRDVNGVTFRLKCDNDVYLVPGQKIQCVVSKPSINKMVLMLDKTKRKSADKCMSHDFLLETCNISDVLSRYIQFVFNKHEVFAEAREYKNQSNPEWIVKALLAVDGVEGWHNLSNVNKEKLLKCYHDICLYLLEDSDYLLQFSEYERDNYQEWIADRVSVTETYFDSLSIIRNDRCSEEIDNIFNKIKNSGYIYHPHRKMNLLISLFSMKPELLESKIEVILDIIAESAKNWKLPSFNHAFSSFLQFYILSNRDNVNREAVIENEQSNNLLNRMVRSICYLLLMTNGEGINSQLYRSLLYHYLSFVRSRSLHGKALTMQDLSDALIEHSFAALLLTEEPAKDLTWDKDIRHTEVFAYQMSKSPSKSTTFITRSFESGNVRFTASTEGITFSHCSHTEKEKNILPKGIFNWHNLQIFLDSPSKYTISKQSKLKTWRSFWNNVEDALFEKRISAPRPKKSTLSLEVGAEISVRVLWKDDNRPNRYYCKVEDNYYEGEGWIDTYQKGGSIGLFHYDPMLDLNSFYIDGKPMLLKVRVNSIGSPKDEHPTYTFDAISYIDAFMRDQAEYGEESDCSIRMYDANNDVYIGVSQYGYGIFLKETDEYPIKIGDTVKVRLTDYSKANAIQGEVIGAADQLVDIKEAAEQVLRDYCGDSVYEESQDELDEEAMSASEDLFDNEHMKQVVSLLDHKSIIETDNTIAYAYLAVAHIISRMIDDTVSMDYLEKRQRLLSILEEYGENGRVNDCELEKLGSEHSDMVEHFPLLKQRLTEIRIVNSFGQQDKNTYLWGIVNEYDSDNILNKLARLLLSYNMADGFGLQEQQKTIIAKIKGLLNVNVELPEIYSFGEENQTTEFKTSIVFPPNNNMREDIKLQTFNIMKVICGMANAYGGILYLGVDDKTGIARGLENDLHFFEDSKDKFDNYVRCQIRYALGDAVNASVVIEHPDVGKQWVYAIKIKASKTPVCLKSDNNYYLREGASTFCIEDVQQLVEIMNSRNFSQYNAEVAEYDENSAKSSDTDTQEKKEKRNNEKGSPTDHISTSKLRQNITENWQDGYGEETIFYLRIQSFSDWCILDDIEWEDGILTLAIHEEEKDGSIIIVYADGMVNRVPIPTFNDKTKAQIYKMYAHKRPIFISPARKDAALLTVNRDDKNKLYLRLDDISNIEEGKMMSSGKTLTDVELEDVCYCEIINKDYLNKLKKIHNQNRKSIGFPYLATYEQKDLKALKELNITLSELIK